MYICITFFSVAVPQYRELSSNSDLNISRSNARRVFANVILDVILCQPDFYLATRLQCEQLRTVYNMSQTNTYKISLHINSSDTTFLDKHRKPASVDIAAFVQSISLFPPMFPKTEGLSFEER